MPGWHKQIKDLVKDDKIEMVGIIQEQHPDRCRLFAQWQQFDWPILHDPLNVIPTRAVPVVIAIDEHGVVQSTRPRPDWVRNEFIKTDYPKPEKTAAPVTIGKLSLEQMQKLPMTLEAARSSTIWGSAAYRAAKKNGDSAKKAHLFSKAIAAYDAVLAKEPKNAVAHFGRGVALRMRYESEERQASDFQAAVDAWGAALEVDPNHYIYRRRIQQYGPRLMKPYPFYDWVPQARADIRKRGEEPIQLAVEPGGAEIAKPNRNFDSKLATDEPDPQGRINRDTLLIAASTVTVPARTKPGATTRVHVTFRPNDDAHWNNEAEPAQVWITAPDGWKLERNRFELAQAKQAESVEARTFEFEVKLPKDATDAKLQGYALYYVCEDKEGKCLYLRRDFEVTVRTTTTE